MKKILSTVTLAFCFAALFAGKGIVVTQKYTGADAANGASVTVTWYATETLCKMKMDYKDDKVSTTNWFIPDLGTSELLTYGDGALPAGVQKTYYKISAKQISASGGAGTGDLKVVKTGETKTISGFACEKILVTGAQGETEMWVTKDFKANVYRYTNFFKTVTELAALNQEKIGGFPISSVTKDSSGKIVSALELVSASTSELSDSDFKVPADYKEASTK